MPNLNSIDIYISSLCFTSVFFFLFKPWGKISCFWFDYFFDHQDSGNCAHIQTVNYRNCSRCITIFLVWPIRLDVSTVPEQFNYTTSSLPKFLIQKLYKAANEHFKWLSLWCIFVSIIGFFIYFYLKL